MNQTEEPFFFLPSLEGPTLTEQLQLPQGRGIQWLTEGWEGSTEGGDLVPFLGWEVSQLESYRATLSCQLEKI